MFKKLSYSATVLSRITVVTVKVTKEFAFGYKGSERADFVQVHKKTPFLTKLSMFLAYASKTNLRFASSTLSTGREGPGEPSMPQKSIFKIRFFSRAGTIKIMMSH
jgi:hypothetical protein